MRLPVDNHKSALREYGDPTGKRSAVKVACCVWGGGKAETPYLSRQNGPFGEHELSTPWDLARMPLITAIQRILGHSPGDRAPLNWLHTHRYHRNAEVQTPKIALLPSAEANGPFCRDR